MFDKHKNFGRVDILTPPSPGMSGTSMVGTVAQMHLLPVPPFNATMVPRGRQPRFENSEIVRVISANSETGAIEVLRAQEDTTARDIGLGWELIVTITSKLFDDVEEIVADHAARLLEIEHAIGFDTRVPLAMEPSQIIIGEITRNAAGGITSAGVKWPDGSLGTFTALVFNASHPGAIDSYEVTHDDLGITYFQDVVERDANGLVINRTQANNALAMITETNPDRVEVYNMTNGKHLATFTEGAKSVHLYKNQTLRITLSELSLEDGGHHQQAACGEISTVWTALMR
jgi:hypothetical protein